MHILTLSMGNEYRQGGEGGGLTDWVSLWIYKYRPAGVHQVKKQVIVE